MGAEPDLSPPPMPVPEPTMSPEPDLRGHDNQKQSWKADMMSALGESVSFGRFLAEPLDWAKWSSFQHNRYLEEAARQARPGSVAQKKALLEAHYARKRKVQAEAEVGADADAGVEDGAGGEVEDEGAGGAASSASSAAGSSCMTDDDAAAAGQQEVCGGGAEDPDDAAAVECGAGAGGALAGVAAEAVEAITNSVGSACKVDDEAADPSRNRESDVLQAKEKKQGSSNGHLVDGGLERQPLKESSVVNQDVTDSAKKRRLQMPSLFQKTSKLGSPCPSSSGNKGQSSSSAKRRSVLHSSKENASPPSAASSKPSASSAVKRRSALSALHISMSFSRCESGPAASSSRNLGTTIAERIIQLQSASRPVENTQAKEFRPPRKVSCGALPDVAAGVSQVGEQRSSHVMSIKQKLFGSASPSTTQNPGSTREKQRKPDNEQLKGSRQLLCFKTRPLPNFFWKNKEAKDSSQQNAQEIPHLPNISDLQSDVNHKHQMGKGVSKEKQICCFPIRKLH